jgi:hypothetical protein
MFRILSGVKWLLTRFGLVIGFIRLKLVTAINCSATANLDTKQFTIARVKSSQSVLTACRLVTASIAVDSSASVFEGFSPRWLASVSQLTRRFWAMIFNNGVSSASHTSASGRLFPTTSDRSVFLLLTTDSRLRMRASLYCLGKNRTENFASKSSSIVACKLGCGHVTSTEPLPSNEYVFRPVPKQRTSLMALQFRFSAGMSQ